MPTKVVSVELILPEQVTPGEAARVIAFLNSARTPEEIDRAVEIPYERDVGVRLARRLLKRRDELGGYTSIQQVADVPLIGPERFSEIVYCLARRPPPEPAEITVQTITRLQKEVETLETTLLRLKNSFGSLLRVSLRAVQANPLLGQPVTLIAQAVDLLENEPRPNVRLLVSSSWGKLRAFDGARFVQGSVVTALTDLDGKVSLILLPPTSEDLWDIQQHALQDILSILDSSAPNPGAILSAFQEVARHYLWEANEDLRRAIDIYFRDLRPQLLETINYRDYLQDWMYFDANVMAYSGGGGAAGGEAGSALEGSSTGGGAAIHVRFKDWLGPLLQVYTDLPELSDELQRRFGDARQYSKDAISLIGQVYQNVDQFTKLQRGRLGQHMARAIVERNLNDFLSANIKDLPTPDGQDILPALQGAANMVATSETAALTAMANMRSELYKEINLRISERGG